MLFASLKTIKYNEENMFGLTFTPTAFFMLPLALGLDIVGIILVLCGLDDFGMTDVVGIIFVNTWLVLRNKKPLNVKGRKGAINKVKKIFTGKWSKFIIPSFGEIIPYLGCLPFWTLSVYCYLCED